MYGSRAPVYQAMYLACATTCFLADLVVAFWCASQFECSVACMAAFAWSLLVLYAGDCRHGSCSWSIYWFMFNIKFGPMSSVVQPLTFRLQW